MAIEIYSPLKGKVIPLSEVKDEVFSQKMMGEGIAFIPEENFLHAPADGRIDSLIDSCHAVGFHTDSGADVLIHIGQDTVTLNGKYFKARIKEGDVVKQGDILIEFDRQKIESEGYNITTPMVIANTDEYSSVLPVDMDNAECGDLAILIEK
ncbi:MAG: PTS glucose transporter subunit IIA [Treponema sp.]|nr:PTS glucose transporter subunit IIA [Treponema sp.]